MFFLLSAALCSTLLGFIFKLFFRFGIDSFQAIVFNYFVCVLVGCLVFGDIPFDGGSMDAPWFRWALFLGVVFISGFNLAALTVKFFSVTLSQIMQKMSILITVPFAILAYRESAGLFKMTGIALAFLAIILVNLPGRKALDGRAEGLGAGAQTIWIPVLTWVLSGVIESCFVMVYRENWVRQGDPGFLILVFGAAGVLGLLICLAGWTSGRMRFSWKNVAAGVALGIPNYGSMYFIIMALQSGLEGSRVFPWTNVSIILFSTFGAFWLFQERLSRVNWIGIGLAAAAIIFISL